MRTSPFHPSESAPGSPRAVTPVPTKTEEVSNLKTLPKGLSASLPDLDSENWIEVKKRPRPSPARPKVGGAQGPEGLSQQAGWLCVVMRAKVSSDYGKAGGPMSFSSEDHLSGQLLLCE